MGLTSTDPATVLSLRQLPHTYQQLYQAFSQQPRNHQEGTDVYIRSTQMVEEEEADDFKAEGAAVGVAKEATEDKTK